MDIHFQTQGTVQDVRPLLRKSGWRLDGGGPADFHASHPEAKDQATARARLYLVGMLTSSRVRIEFGPQE
jgi:hypothetical protein